MNQKINIGLFGYGVVGESLHHVLKHSKTVDAGVRKICVKQKDKKRSLEQNEFTFNKDDIINDQNINLVVELIDDADEAYDIVKRCLQNKKSVVSGNKKMLAHHLDELIDLQEKTDTALLYDASACGSIPIIRNIEEYYDNDLLKSVTGILNGSSNYILSKIFNEGLDYDTALKQAQELGFAESNPGLDVDGFDSLYKLIIIATHALGTFVKPNEVLNYGISNIKEYDIQFAREKNFKIKLVAQLIKLNDESFTMFVIPRLVRPDKYIYNVEDEYNGVVIQGEFYDKQFMFGKGAGGYPTGSAVLSDITARSHNYKYEYKKQKYFKKLEYRTDHEIEIYLRYNSMVDFSYFEFETILEKYSGIGNSYIIGKIKLANLLKLKAVLTKLDVFLAYIRN
ncbi:MAG: homoserine dehydrogenase [Marinilabiliales bacterium]|nr:MAG: homoserine dehydrogenase [Marinilabiliales bacterium]